MTCTVPGCVVKTWGHVNQHGIPHAPTELRVCSGRCPEKCACGRPCGKYNGHEWYCGCFSSGCHDGVPTHVEDDTADRRAR